MGFFPTLGEAAMTSIIKNTKGGQCLLTLGAVAVTRHMAYGVKNECRVWSRKAINLHAHMSLIVRTLYVQVVTCACILLILCKKIGKYYIIYPKCTFKMYTRQ